MTAVSRSMSPDELALRLRQQEIAARFGLYALDAQGLEATLHEASSAAAVGLNTHLAKVLRYRPETADFLMVSGVGWRAGVVGHVTLPASPDTPAGQAIASGRPMVAGDLTAETRFRVPTLLQEHSVQSTISVVIGPVDNASYGVLEADSTHRQCFSPADTLFLQAIANVLAAAIARNSASVAKDRLLQEKDLLMREVHHRVKNSLQLVQNMLQLQARSVGEDARWQLEEAAIRIRTIGSVHHRLYAGPSVQNVQAAEFLKALLADMHFMLPESASVRDVTLRAPAIVLSAHATTALGLIVTELVTNAVKYAAQPIGVTVDENSNGLLVTVEDHGPGFPLHFDPERGTGGLGMRLLRTLASPAPGSVRVDRSVPHGRVSVLMKP